VLTRRCPSNRARPNTAQAGPGPAAPLLDSPPLITGIIRKFPISPVRDEVISCKAAPRLAARQHQSHTKRTTIAPSLCHASPVDRQAGRVTAQQWSLAVHSHHVSHAQDHLFGRADSCKANCSKQFPKPATFSLHCFLITQIDLYKTKCP
jgi:hypothetical protein